MEDNVYQLSAHQASELKRGQTILIVFPLPPTLAYDAHKSIPFDFKQSEPHYPVQVYPEEVPNPTPKAAQKEYFYQNRVELAQYARFWHYLGDATHHSQLVPTPHLWYPDLTIEVENKYNHPIFWALVKDIALAQTPDESWVWVVSLSAID